MLFNLPRGIRSAFEIPPLGHVNEHPLPWPVYLESFSLAVDMVDYQPGGFFRVGLESPFPADKLLHLLEKAVVHFPASRRRSGDSEHRKNTGAYDMLSY